MELINMKQSNKSETGIAPAESEAPRYPYGLELRLDKESLDKLGVKTLLSVGTEIMITAKAYVSSTSAYEYQGEGKEINMGLQITDLALSATVQSQDKATLLYGE